MKNIQTQDYEIEVVISNIVCIKDKQGKLLLLTNVQRIIDTGREANRIENETREATTK